MDIKKKYLKYKIKYLELKGGGSILFAKNPTHNNNIYKEIKNSKKYCIKDSNTIFSPLENHCNKNTDSVYDQSKLLIIQTNTGFKIIGQLISTLKKNVKMKWNFENDSNTYETIDVVRGIFDDNSFKQ